jgi:hypothetical protein
MHKQMNEGGYSLIRATLYTGRFSRVGSSRNRMLVTDGEFHMGQAGVQLLTCWADNEVQVGLSPN